MRMFVPCMWARRSPMNSGLFQGPTCSGLSQHRLTLRYQGEFCLDTFQCPFFVSVMTLTITRISRRVITAIPAATFPPLFHTRVLRSQFRFQVHLLWSVPPEKYVVNSTVFVRHSTSLPPLCHLHFVVFVVTCSRALHPLRHMSATRIPMLQVICLPTINRHFVVPSQNCEAQLSVSSYAKKDSSHGVRLWYDSLHYRRGTRNGHGNGGALRCTAPTTRMKKADISVKHKFMFACVRLHSYYSKQLVIAQLCMQRCLQHYMQNWRTKKE